MTDHIEDEFAALKRDYYTYLEQFRATHGVSGTMVPLTVRQYCAAAVLCAQAWESRDLMTVSELQTLMLLG
jgi:hypothetical protein